MHEDADCGHQQADYGQQAAGDPFAPVDNLLSGIEDWGTLMCRYTLLLKVPDNHASRRTLK
jgi:hypothetical protein